MWRSLTALISGKSDKKKGKKGPPGPVPAYVPVRLPMEGIPPESDDGLSFDRCLACGCELGGLERISVLLCPNCWESLTGQSPPEASPGGRGGAPGGGEGA